MVAWSSNVVVLSIANEPHIIKAFFALAKGYTTLAVMQVDIRDISTHVYTATMRVLLMTLSISF
jgi:hypothetical protein